MENWKKIIPLDYMENWQKNEEIWKFPLNKMEMDKNTKNAKIPIEYQ